VTTWFPDPYIEGNFIWMTEMEKNQLARADQTFLVKTVQHVFKAGQFGANTDIELPMFNMVTRFVFLAQRSDRALYNDWDNYTNWENENRAPWSSINSVAMTNLYTSGQQQVSSVIPKLPLVDAVLLLDGKERFQTKPMPFFSLLQMYKHTTGVTPESLPGVYQYSFALDNDQYQPSGAINGSMFNKITLRTNLQQPLPASTTTTTTTVVCILKSTAFSQNPVVIPAGQVNATNPDGSRIYNENDLLSAVQTNGNIIFTFTYNVSAYVESINFLRVVSGLANLVFAS
jgi:hypothetical protein